MEQLVAIYASDDAEARQELAQWWNKVASVLRIDAGLLRPSDRFDSELAPLAGFPIEDEIVALNDLIDDLGLSDQQKQQLSRLETFGELVSFLSCAMSVRSENEATRKSE